MCTQGLHTAWLDIFSKCLSKLLPTLKRAFPLITSRTNTLLVNYPTKQQATKLLDTAAADVISASQITVKSGY